MDENTVKNPDGEVPAEQETPRDTTRTIGRVVRDMMLQGATSALYMIGSPDNQLQITVEVVLLEVNGEKVNDPVGEYGVPRELAN